ncbi:hypothetical protein SDC9_212403 [bioreactor metagenome]|uniref:Uncharacterized protein n=1 Tax=bioreactor metagenome TaxID=1076179 RepID=A0A645JMR2_9ZZZZ
MCFVIGYLLPFHRQRLCEITITVEKTYCRHIHIAVARFLQIIACENSQTARVDVQYMGKAVFHAEIGYTGAFPVVRYFHVLFEFFVDEAYTLH